MNSVMLVGVVDVLDLFVVVGMSVRGLICFVVLSGCRFFVLLFFGIVFGMYVSVCGVCLIGIVDMILFVSVLMMVSVLLFFRLI